MVAAATPPVLMSIAAAGMTAGGFQWHHFNEYQGFLPIHWVAFSNPGALIACLVYFCSGMLIFSLPPFSTARPQNASIFLGNSGAVGLQEAWGRLALRVAPICWNLMGAQIFLGGDRVPRAFLSALEPVPAVAGFLSLGLLMVKVILVQAVMTILGRTLPAVRSDQAHDFAWRALYPAAIIALVCIRVFGFGSWGEGL
ncbi:hypothetical protein EBZ37_10430 [bacterium]|nr:hypothetical protein [bacterium]